MSAPVKHTCPDIDSLQDDIKRFTNDVIGELESLRRANAALRDWGEDLEKELAEANDKIEELEQQLAEKELTNLSS